jgi:tetratricopeptide (TPR) repeat protein
MRRLALGLMLLTGTLPACSDENASANQILVQTSEIAERAKSANPKDAIALYEQAIQNLSTIVAKYPGSNLAAQLASGQEVGNISRAKFETRLGELRCRVKPTPECVFGFELRTASAITGFQPRAWWISEHVAELGRRQKRAEFVAIREKLEASERASATVDFVRGLLESGHVDDAKTWAGTIEIDPVLGGYQRSYAYAEIASWLARAGQLDEAKGLTRRFSDPSEAATVVEGIVSGLIDVGKLPDEWELLRTVAWEKTSPSVWLKFAYAYLKAGDLSGAKAALDSALRTKGSAYYIDIRVALGRLAREQGNESLLREVREQGQQRARMSDRESRREGIRMLAQLGFVQDIIEIANTHDAMTRDAALYQGLSEMVRAANFDGAEELFAAMGPRQREPALTVLISHETPKERLARYMAELKDTQPTEPARILWLASARKRLGDTVAAEEAFSRYFEGVLAERDVKTRLERLMTLRYVLQDK